MLSAENNLSGQSGAACRPRRSRRVQQSSDVEQRVVEAPRLEIALLQADQPAEQELRFVFGFGNRLRPIERRRQIERSVCSDQKWRPLVGIGSVRSISMGRCRSRMRTPCRECPARRGSRTPSDPVQVKSRVIELLERVLATQLNEVERARNEAQTGRRDLGFSSSCRPRAVGDRRDLVGELAVESEQREAVIRWRLEAHAAERAPAHQVRALVRLVLDVLRTGLIRRPREKSRINPSSICLVAPRVGERGEHSEALFGAEPPAIADDHRNTVIGRGGLGSGRHVGIHRSAPARICSSVTRRAVGLRARSRRAR